MSMSKTEALEVLVTNWSAISDQLAEKLAAQVIEASQTPETARFESFNFTLDQLEALKRSRADIAAGRVYDVDEAEALTDAFLLSRGI